VTGSVSGNAGSATKLATARTVNVSGDVTGTAQSFDGSTNITIPTAITADSIVNADINSAAAIADTKLATISTAGKVSNSATTATTANTASTIVLRDATGAIPGNITGSAASLAGTVAIVNGGTGATTAATALSNLGAAASSHTHSIATTTANGFMSAADKVALASSISTSNTSLYFPNLGLLDIQSVDPYGVANARNSSRSWFSMAREFIFNTDYTDIPISSLNPRVWMGNAWSPSDSDTTILRIHILNFLLRESTTTGASAAWRGGYTKDICIEPVDNASGYRGFTANGTTRVDVESAFGQVQNQGVSGLGWASIYASAPTTTANGAVYLRLRAHATADNASYWYWSRSAFFIEMLNI
jgi:hypothetical protein